jgi:hypothetical protein
MNPKQYLTDYYSNSPNDSIMTQLSNFGSEAGGGKAAIDGLLQGLTTPVKLVAEGFTKGNNYLTGKILDRDLSQDTNKRLNDINNFFTNDSLQESSQQNPTINKLGNVYGGTALGSGSNLVKSGLQTSIPNEIGNALANYSIQNQPKNTSLVSQSINALGDLAKQPVKLGMQAVNSLDSMFDNEYVKQAKMNKQQD